MFGGRADRSGTNGSAAWHRQCHRTPQSSNSSGTRGALVHDGPASPGAARTADERTSVPRASKSREFARTRRGLIRHPSTLGIDPSLRSAAVERPTARIACACCCSAARPDSGCARRVRGSGTPPAISFQAESSSGGCGHNRPAASSPLHRHDSVAACWMIVPTGRSRLSLAASNSRCAVQRGH